MIHVGIDSAPISKATVALNGKTKGEFVANLGVSISTHDKKKFDACMLIKDMTSHTPRSIGSKQIRKIVHQLYVKAGLLKQPRGRMYELRVHSLRKYFKTQMLALGVQPDYVDYMMGHTLDTYHDIQMKGIEFLRNI